MRNDHPALTSCELLSSWAQSSPVLSCATRSVADGGVGCGWAGLTGGAGDCGYVDPGRLALVRQGVPAVDLHAAEAGLGQRGLEFLAGVQGALDVR
jgi:hypothetical protein